jgi:hypothetical protein
MSTLPALEPTDGPRQLQLEDVVDSRREALGITFQESRREPVHRWYPYVEGFSAPYVRSLIAKGGYGSIFDPFGGAGTTQLTAAASGVASFYAEVNPFMVFVAETKVNGGRWARGHLKLFREAARDFIGRLHATDFMEAAAAVPLDGYYRAFPSRDFFVESDLRELLTACRIASEYESVADELRDLLLLACAANTVRASNMTRRADLRRRRADEYKNRVVDVRAFIAESVCAMVLDVEALPAKLAPMTRVAEDCRQLPEEFEGSFDLALTSPPYLNGTNYFRNTKLELWLLGLIESESRLSEFRQAAIAAGINNVSTRRGAHRSFPEVEAVAARLDETDGDRRIPRLVRLYFSDMFDVLHAVRRGLRPGARFVLDIGDSKFYGVHVATDQLLASIAAEAGFELERSRLLARRVSRDKSPLVQMELTFRKPRLSAGGGRRSPLRP